MHSSDDANDQRERIPQLAPGWAPEDIVLTPAEGFLISRIDGQTPWAMLRQIGGLSPEQVDDYLDRWVEAGAIQFIETSSASPGESAESVCTCAFSWEDRLESSGVAQDARLPVSRCQLPHPRWRFGRRKCPRPGLPVTVSAS